MQVDALKQKAKPSEVVVTPVQTPQPVSGATPVILTPPPVSLCKPRPCPCMLSIPGPLAAGLTTGICIPDTQARPDKPHLAREGACSLRQKQATDQLQVLRLCSADGVAMVCSRR